MNIVTIEMNSYEKLDSLESILKAKGWSSIYNAAGKLRGNVITFWHEGKEKIVYDSIFWFEPWESVEVWYKSVEHRIHGVILIRQNDFVLLKMKEIPTR